MHPFKGQLRNLDADEISILYPQQLQQCTAPNTKRKEKNMPTESKALQKFNEQIITKALASIDQDKLIKPLAKHLEKQIASDIKNWLNGGIDFGEWILEDLQNNNTKMGGNFQAAMDQITQRMIEAVLKKEK